MKKVRLFAPLIVSTLSIPTVCLVGCNETPTVGVPVEGVQMARTNAGCSINDKLTLEYTIEPSDATDKSVT
ncbi:MAG: hypothetical protein MJ195_01485 [Mycoplasmoidaceae bacterium]|nr:hypothetical protein [Mycoplasmoidaceae bacterium]